LQSELNCSRLWAQAEFLGSKRPMMSGANRGGNPERQEMSLVFTLLPLQHSRGCYPRSTLTPIFVLVLDRPLSKIVVKSLKTEPLMYRRAMVLPSFRGRLYDWPLSQAYAKKASVWIDKASGIGSSHGGCTGLVYSRVSVSPLGLLQRLSRCRPGSCSWWMIRFGSPGR